VANVRFGDKRLPAIIWRIANHYRVVAKTVQNHKFILLAYIDRTPKSATGQVAVLQSLRTFSRNGRLPSLRSCSG
jgi:hypothetical protein